MKLSMVALATAAAGAIGLGTLTVPAVAGSDPTLPDVSAEDLVASVLTAQAPAFGGTVEVDNALGLPTLPGLSEGPSPLTQPVTTIRVWSDGQGRGRLALPSRSGEQVLIEDGTTLWHYDSSSRTATAREHGAARAPERAPVADPAEAARALVGAVQASSTVAVDGTAEVAGRPVYELVLTPKPTERTLLREVRVAVDSAERVPLQLTVLANGSPDPALQIGFTDLQVGPQDPGLFEFTPPEGVTVQRPEQRPHPGPDQEQGQEPPGHPGGAAGIGQMVRVEGDGWDTVVLGQLPITPAEPGADLPAPDMPAPDMPEPSGPMGGPPGRATDPWTLIRQIGQPTSGPWGDGWVVQTAVGTVLVASDGRIAAGAVPQQVLAEALAR